MDDLKKRLEQTINQSYISFFEMFKSTEIFSEPVLSFKQKRDF